jgi:mannosidase alpha-like ER degradation enhancer 2
VETGQWTNPIASIGGGIDSYDEYLLKCWLLFGDQDCKRMWESTINAVNKYLADDEKSGFWYGQADIYTGTRTTHEYGALDAFFPALLALGGDLKRAEALQRSSFQMWTLYGILSIASGDHRIDVLPVAPDRRPALPEYGACILRRTGEMGANTSRLYRAARCPDNEAG